MPQKKVHVTIGSFELELDVTAYVKWEERAKAQKKTVGELLSIFLTSEGSTNP